MSRIKLALTLRQRAKYFAEAAHRGQVRKYTDEPYFSHCENVAKLVFMRTRDKDMWSKQQQDTMICAAWLHDTLEDTKATVIQLEKYFGDGVARLVCELSDTYTPEAYPHLNRAERKKLECQRYKWEASESAKLVKLCDVIDNTRNIVECDPNFAVQYLREKADLLEALGYGRR